MIIICTLFEAQIWDPLYGRISLLHEHVEIFKELFLFFFHLLYRPFGSLLLDLYECHIHVCLGTQSTEETTFQFAMCRPSVLTKHTSKTWDTRWQCLTVRVHITLTNACLTLVTTYHLFVLALSGVSPPSRTYRQYTIDMTPKKQHQCTLSSPSFHRHHLDKHIRKLASV